MHDKGGRGPKKVKNLRDVIYGWPLGAVAIYQKRWYNSYILGGSQECLRFSEDAVSVSGMDGAKVGPSHMFFRELIHQFLTVSLFG